MRQDVEIKTADGAASAALFAPAGPNATLSGVILYMDAFGLRPALYGMAEKLADAGYFVLVPDLFYRSAPYGPFDTTAFSNETTRVQLRAMLQATTQAMTERDGAAFIETLTAAGATGPIGAVGYCFGGGRALTAAAAYPDRIAAAASFRQSRQRRARQPASERRFDPGARLCRRGRRRRELPAGAIGEAGRGAARGRRRPHPRELCRHGAWLGGQRSWRL